MRDKINRPGLWFLTFPLMLLLLSLIVDPSRYDLFCLAAPLSTSRPSTSLYLNSENDVSNATNNFKTIITKLEKAVSHLQTNRQLQTVGIIIGYDIYDAKNNTRIGPLTNGQVIVLSQYGLTLPSDINVVAIAGGNASVGSVAFVLSTLTSTIRRYENFVPYAVCGNNGNKISNCPSLKNTTNLQVTVQSTPYEKKNMGGKAGTPNTISFQIVLNRPPTTPPTLSPRKPTRPPTKKPTRPPTKKPTRPPTKKPTRPPTKKPTTAPSRKPTKAPIKPTISPIKPTISPRKPTKAPKTKSTMSPKKPSKPTSAPTKAPTKAPTTRAPTLAPTMTPTTYKCFESNEELQKAIDSYRKKDNSTIKEVYGDPIGTWCVKYVTDFSYAFDNVNDPFNEDISNWDVSRATNMKAMFQYANSFNQDLSKWSVSKVTDMTYMFYAARRFNGNISGWNVAKVTSMDSMFTYANDFNTDISAWNVSAVTNMYCMFLVAISFNQDISKWGVSSVTDMRYMFSQAFSFNQDISQWDVSGVTSFDSMFVFAGSFRQNLCAWGLRILTTAYVAQMFELSGCIDSSDPILVGSTKGPFCDSCTA